METKKIVINKCWGGFGISNEALLELIEIKSEIVNKICDKYKCRLVSLSMNEGDEKFSRKTYLFTFRK